MPVTQTLTVTEVAVDNLANTSKIHILWQSTQTGDSWNGYTRTAKFYVSINGGAEKEYSTSYTLPKGTTKTIVDTTITVSHKDDGTGTVKVRTWMDTRLNAGVIEKEETITLTTTPRASTILYVSNVTLGNRCTVRWIPNSKEYRFKIKFEIGNWSLTTEAIHPDITTLYTNSSYGISLDAAHQFPNSKDADMKVSLYTYSDKECTKQLGTISTETCKAFIPENENTLPTVVMSLSPVNSLLDKFKGLYIQGKTKVKADFTGSEAKYSASISSYSMNVEGKNYGSPYQYQSDFLSTAGTVSVKGTVVDSRGCSATIPQDITVIPYSKPIIVPYSGESSIICKRCDSEGNLTPSGTCLRIKAGRQYSKVISDGIQKNFCILQFRHKVEGATAWSSLTTILSQDNSHDGVDAILTDINLSLSTAYIGQIEVIDEVGESSSILINIPTADCTYHLRKGGKAIGVGKYAEKDYIVDIDDDWEVNVRGVFRANHIAAIDAYSYKDFNELIYNTGYYIGSSAPSTSSCMNYPIDETGLLEVISAMTQDSTTLAWWGFAYQTYRTNKGNVYMRSYFSTTGWTAWKKVTLT